jgi:hypothetical protein
MAKLKGNEAVSGHVTSQRLKNRMICPFFKRGMSYCDVGCGYVSPHDVKVMASYCISRHGECSKYQDLAGRFPLEGERDGGPYENPCLS